MPDWTDERHEAARKRCEAATDGPWCTDERYPGMVYCDDDFGSRVADCNPRMPPRFRLTENSTFIAHAREDLPDCMATLDATKADRDRWKARAERAEAQAERLHAALVDAGAPFRMHKRGPKCFDPDCRKAHLMCLTLEMREAGYRNATKAIGWFLEPEDA